MVYLINNQYGKHLKKGWPSANGSHLVGGGGSKERAEGIGLTSLYLI